MEYSARARERGLLVWVTLFMLVGLGILLVTKADTLNTEIYLYGGMTIGSFWVINLVLQYWGRRGDPYLLPLTAMLCSVGTVLLFRLRPEYALKQSVWLMIAAIGMLAVIAFTKNYERLEEYRYVYIVIGIFALFLTAFLGRRIGGATSWIDLYFFRVQPAEMVKIFLVIFLASFLEEHREMLAQGSWQVGNLRIPHPRHFGPLLMMWGLSVLFLVVQRDLGAALLFFGTFLAMVYMATGRKGYVVLGLGMFLVAAVGAYLLFSHVQTRVQIWIDPWAFAESKGYQIVQSLFSLASGGITGTGLGLGFPKFVPEVHTDFIFSAIVEELGLMGGIGVVLIYIFFIYRGFRIALLAKTGFGTLLAGGLTALMAIQTLTILGGVTKLIPLTGITLPFVSYGGSSMVANFVLLGLLLNVSHRNDVS